MGNSISLCIVGAGSSYTPELIDGLLKHPEDELPVGEIRLVDTDRERLAVMAGLSERMIGRSGRKVRVVSGTVLKELIGGTDFVVTQIRVGGMEARLLDESIPLKYGVIGQETTGPGGMFKALRTIPPMLSIAKIAEEKAPEAHILNYTNPSGIITEAVLKHTGARFIGLCSGMPRIQEEIRERLKDRYPDLRTTCVGLNHLGFVNRFYSGGRDVTAEALELLSGTNAEREGDNAAMQAGRLSRIIDAVPISYADYYFFRDRRFRETVGQERTRAQEIMEIEKKVFREARTADTRPLSLDQRGGRGYSDVTFRAMSAVWNDTHGEMTVSTANRGAVECIDPDAAVEVLCRLDKKGATPMPVGSIPPALRGLIQSVKAYESLVVEAAVTRRKKTLLQAMLNHPLLGDLDICEPMMEEMLQAHGLEYS